MKDIYTIKLGESAHVGPIELFRVPGGWLALTIRGVCFVPFHGEFMQPSPDYLESFSEKPAKGFGDD